MMNWQAMVQQIVAGTLQGKVPIPDFLKIGKVVGVIHSGLEYHTDVDRQVAF